MKKIFRNRKSRLLLLAIVIVLFAEILTIKEGYNVPGYYLGFFSRSLMLHKSALQFPFGLQFNLIQFAANVGVIWFILYYMNKVFRRLVYKIIKRPFF